MGLDMYLSRKRYIKQWDHISPDKQYAVTLTRGGKPIQLVNPSYLTEEIMYWRKANHIHKWFVDNVQGGRDECQESICFVDDLKKLVSLCERVLADHSLAPALLPTQSGFFFGGTEYDEYYFEDLKETVDKLKPVIQEEATDEWLDFIYQSSW